MSWRYLDAILAAAAKPEPDWSPQDNALLRESNDPVPFDADLIESLKEHAYLASYHDGGCD